MTIDFLREPDVSPDQFFSLVDEGMHGMIRFAVVHAAGVLGLFDQLDGRGCTVLDLAALLGIDERSLSPLLSILCEIGLVSGEGEVYTNTPLASVFMVSDSPYCQKGHIHKNAVFLEKIWATLPERLVHGPLVFDREVFFRDLSLPAMAENALTGRLQRTVREVIAMPEFATAKRMLDLGGGHGLYAIAFAAVNPGLTAYVFDLPHVTPLARTMIRNYHASRVSPISGNFFTDDIGTGYDIIFSSSNPGGKSPALLTRIAGALNSGGLFVNVQSDDAKSDDPYHELEWQLWTLGSTGKGTGRYTREQPFMTREYRDALRAAGFEVVRERQIRDDYHRESTVHLVIAKKVGEEKAVPG